MRSPAPEFPLAPPQVDLEGSECSGGFRTFEFRAKPAAGVRSMLLVGQSDRDTGIVALNGRMPTEVESFRKGAHRAESIELRGVPAQGMALRMRIAGCGKLVMRVIERWNDLSVVFPGGVPPLSPGVMTAWEDDYYNSAVVVTRFLNFE